MEVVFKKWYFKRHINFDMPFVSDYIKNER